MPSQAKESELDLRVKQIDLDKAKRVIENATKTLDALVLKAPRDGIAVKVWSLPQQAVGALLATIPAPLGLGRLTLDDGRAVPGFIAGPEALQGTDISGYGGWRAYVDPGPHPARDQRVTG